MKIFLTYIKQTVFRCFFYLVLKLFAQKVKHELGILYFLGYPISKDKTLSVLSFICNLLDQPDYLEYKKRITDNISGIIIYANPDRNSTWYRTGEIIIKYGEHFSENYIYILSVLIWFSYCLEMKKQNVKMPSSEINRCGFQRLMEFLHKLPDNTSDVEAYFRKAYPSFDIREGTECRQASSKIINGG